MRIPPSLQDSDAMSVLSEAWSFVYSAFRGNEFLMLTLGKTELSYAVLRTLLSLLTQAQCLSSFLVLS